MAAAAAAAAAAVATHPLRVRAPGDPFPCALLTRRDLHLCFEKLKVTDESSRQRRTLWRRGMAFVLQRQAGRLPVQSPPPRPLHRRSQSLTTPTPARLRPVRDVASDDDTPSTPPPGPGAKRPKRTATPRAATPHEALLTPPPSRDSEGETEVEEPVRPGSPTPSDW